MQVCHAKADQNSDRKIDKCIKHGCHLPTPAADGIVRHDLGFWRDTFPVPRKDTIEERILDLQDKKAELLDVLPNEGGSILEMSKDELLALLD